MEKIRYSVKMASKQSGVSTHLMRMWEKRYGAISPERTDTNRRLYSDEQVERLRLLFLCTQAGHRISQVASLSTPTLRELSPESAAQNESVPSAREASDNAAPTDAGQPVEVDDALAAIKALDAAMLARVLDQATVTRGHQGMLIKIVVPLVQLLGQLWREGELSASYEHFASSVLKTYLLGQLNSYAASPRAPVIITVTPAGQLHEIGAVITAAAANSAGWQVIHLGASLPAAEIAGAAFHSGAKIVALSVVHPPDDAELPGQLQMLRRLLPSNVGIVVGGQASSSYHETLEQIKAHITPGLGDFYEVLESVRRNSANG